MKPKTLTYKLSYSDLMTDYLNQKVELQDKKIELSKLSTENASLKEALKTVIDLTETQGWLNTSDWNIIEKCKSLLND